MDTQQVKEALAKWIDYTSLNEEAIVKVVEEFGSIFRLSVEDERELLDGDIA